MDDPAARSAAGFYVVRFSAGVHPALMNAIAHDLMGHSGVEAVFSADLSAATLRQLSDGVLTRSRTTRSARHTRKKAAA
jgi:hypothetical protein